MVFVHFINQLKLKKFQYPKLSNYSMEIISEDLKYLIKDYIIFKPKTTKELEEAVDLWVKCEKYALKLYNHISLWDTSLITDMSYLFQDREDFNENINNWNVSKVTTMEGMFLGAERFNQPLDLWDVSSVTNMWHMFENTHNFNQNISSWDVSSVTNMSHMFFGSSFKQNINSWDVSSVTNMYFMFSGCSSKYHENNLEWYVTSPYK
jgi:surface protein